MSDKIELGMLCGVLQSNFLRLSQSESRTQPCHVRIQYKLANYEHYSLAVQITVDMKSKAFYYNLTMSC